MKTYNQFLIESDINSKWEITGVENLWKGTTKISVFDAINLAITKCSHYLEVEPDILISRDVTLEDDAGTIEYLHINPKKHERRSANTKNYYTLIINNAPSWNEYPKRKLICSLADQKGYNMKEYVVLPYNGSKWGVCPSYDFWWSFPKIGKEYGASDMKTFNNYLTYIGKWVGVTIEHNNIESFKKSLSLIDNGLKEKKKNGEEFKWMPDQDFSQKTMEIDIVHMLEDILEEGAYNFIVNVMNPKNNGFKLNSIKELNPDGNIFFSETEVWTDDECLLIHSDCYGEFISDVKKMKNEK